jgi:two-component system NtrC family response regulator
MAAILIIDDEELIRISLSDRINRLKHTAWAASTLQEGLDLIEKESFDLIFLDVNLPDGSGLDALPLIKNNSSKPEVIIITALGSTQGTKLAIENGAWDYITKPFNKEEIVFHIQRTIDYRKAKQKVFYPDPIDTGAIIGQSIVIKNSIHQIALCAKTDTNVLLFGETGTGKELFAKAIHDNSLVANGEFVIVDCAAMPEALAESVLFGHIKGAFTGADSSSEGLIKKADKGTLFLDEIGELPLPIQKAFLRALQERKFRPVGSSKEVSSKFRLISATNQNLDEMVEQGRFRRDLLHRLKTFSIQLPALRKRKEDIQIIAQHYIKILCKKHSLKNKALLPETLEILESYKWPGNVRELINAIEKALISEPDLSVLYPMFLPDRIRLHFLDKKLDDTDNPGRGNVNFSDFSEPFFSSLIFSDQIPELKSFRISAIEKIETLYFKNLLKKTNWDLEKASQISGVSKSRLYFLIKKYHLKKVLKAFGIPIEYG